MPRRIKILIAVTFIFSPVSVMFAQNPISPQGVYIPDPTVRNWYDWKLNVFGSFIQKNEKEPSKFSGVGYQWALSSSDLINWGITKDIIASVGPNDQISNNDTTFRSPGCIYRDGTCHNFYQPYTQIPHVLVISKSLAGSLTKAKSI